MNEQRVGAYAPLFFLVSFCVCGIILLVLSVNLSISLDKCMCNSELINWSNRIVFILGMIITTATIVSIFYNIGGIRKGLNIQNVANFYRNYGIVLAIVGILVLGAGITMLVANYGKKEEDKKKSLDEKCPDGPCKTNTLGWIISITVFGAIIFAISMFMIFYNQKLKGSKAQTLQNKKGIIGIVKEKVEEKQSQKPQPKQPQQPEKQAEKQQQPQEEVKKSEEQLKKSEEQLKKLEILAQLLPKAPNSKPDVKNKIISTTEELREKLNKLKEETKDKKILEAIPNLLKRSKTVEDKLKN